jgi:1-phosphofructokinase family hexose kinase
MSECDIDVKLTSKGGFGFMLVVGLNQTIDRTIRLPVLAAGQVLRAGDVAITPGGKAVNVCRAAITLGSSAHLVGPFPGLLGGVAVAMLEAEGLPVTPVRVGGELRGTTVVIESGGRTTVINEPGPPLGDAEWNNVVDAVAGATDGGAYVAISGSAPPGTVAGAHRTLIQLVHERGGVVAVDVTAGRLIEAAAAGADLVSPNLTEAEQALGIGPEPCGRDAGEAVDVDHLDSADVEARCRAAAATLVETGAGAALVSAGRHGVACRSAAVDTFVAAPTVAATNPIGAGDSLLGATLVALERGRSLEMAVTDGVAYAAASVAHPVAGYADPALVEELRACRAEVDE